MNIEFTNFILKHQKFYNFLNKHIKYILQHDLDFYANNLYLYKDKGTTWNLYIYIGKNGPDYCLLKVDYNIALGYEDLLFNILKPIFVPDLTNYTLLGKTSL